MPGLVAPFFANDNGDVSVFESVDKMIATIEPVDALDGRHEFFDSLGTVLHPTADPERWHPTASSEEGRPQRLESILRSYFARLPERFADYSTRAARSTSLSELVRLRSELAREPRRTRFTWRGRRRG